MKLKRQKVDLKAVKKRFPSCAAHLDMFEAIRDAVCREEFFSPPRVDREELSEALGSGKTVLDTCLSSLDMKAFSGALSSVLKLLAEKNPDEFANASPRRFPDSLMEDYLLAAKERIEQCARKQGISTGVLVSCCQQAARPQLVALREINSAADLSLWPHGHCPFCGALPAMARIDSNGLRFLMCPNCLAEYRFARHYCPGCGHAGLNVLQMEAWPGILLESCLNCGRYVKTWSAGAGEPPCRFPYLDIVSHDVDEAAGIQGLKRLSLSVMGI